jgi:hypothetical protein
MMTEIEAWGFVMDDLMERQTNDRQRDRAAGEPVSPYGICFGIWEAADRSLITDRMVRKMQRRLPPRTIREAFCWRTNQLKARVEFCERMIHELSLRRMGRKK